METGETENTVGTVDTENVKISIAETEVIVETLKTLEIEKTEVS